MKNIKEFYLLKILTNCQYETNLTRLSRKTEINYPTMIKYVKELFDADYLIKVNHKDPRNKIYMISIKGIRYLKELQKL